MSTTFVEKVTTIVGSDCEIVPLQMKERKTLAQYINQVMVENGEKSSAVEARSKRVGDPISESSINNLLLEKVKNPGVFTLRALARGLGRPVEEVLAAALAELPKDSAVYKETDFANLWEIYKDAPNSEQRIFKRYLQMLAREMLKR